MAKATRIIMYIVIALSIGGLVYRSTVYWLIPVAKGDPYGLGDIIDFLIGSGIFVLVIISCCLSIAAIAWSKAKIIKPYVINSGLAIISLALYMNLHALMPRLL